MTVARRAMDDLEIERCAMAGVPAVRSVQVPAVS
jgi:hypothetical protein